MLAPAWGRGTHSQRGDWWLTSREWTHFPDSGRAGATWRAGQGPVGWSTAFGMNTRPRSHPRPPGSAVGRRMLCCSSAPHLQGPAAPPGWYGAQVRAQKRLSPREPRLHVTRGWQ